MSLLPIDTGVDHVRDLAALLPASVRDRIEPELLTEYPSAAALRVLATIRDERWTQFVYAARIDWAAMLAFGRGDASHSVAVRIELAASLAGALGAAPDLLKAAYSLDQNNFAAFVDALRIAREGLER